MYVRKFARTDTGCSILWSSESLLGCTQAVPSCGQVKAELTCSTHSMDSRHVNISAWLNNLKWGLQLYLWQPRAAESEGDDTEMDLFLSVTNMATFILIPKQSYHITVLQIILRKVQVLWCWVIWSLLPSISGDHTAIIFIVQAAKDDLFRTTWCLQMKAVMCFKILYSCYRAS